MRADILRSKEFKPFSVVITFERKEDLFNEMFGFVHNFDECVQGGGEHYHRLSKDEMCRKIRAAIETVIAPKENSGSPAN